MANNDRLDQVKRLFEAALEQGPSERAVFLQGLGAADSDLRKEVESLLAAERDGFLETTPAIAHSVAPGTAEKSTGIRPPRAETKTLDRSGPDPTLHLLDTALTHARTSLPSARFSTKWLQGTRPSGHAPPSDAEDFLSSCLL